jgi:hypothetical protein
MSICKRCSKVCLATFLIAPCATEAKTAFRSSAKSVVKILAIPSTLLASAKWIEKLRTSCDTSSSQYPNGGTLRNRHVQTINNLLEEEWNLDIEQLSSYQ